MGKMNMKNVSENELPIYRQNCGRVFNMPILPLPPKEGLPHEVNTYEDVDEPRFDPKIHLNLQKPNYIRLLTDFEKTTEMPKVTGSEGSPFAYSSPFQVGTQLPIFLPFSTAITSKLRIVFFKTLELKKEKDRTSTIYR